MNCLLFDDIFTIECNLQYLYEIGRVFEEISMFDNNFYYRGYLITKKYFFIDFEQQPHLVIETDDEKILDKYIENFNEEIFSINKIFLNKSYTIRPIKMIYETYKQYPIINYYLSIFYEWANVVIINHSRIKKEIDFGKTFINTKINPFTFSMMENYLPMYIMYDNKINLIDKDPIRDKYEILDVTDMYMHLF